MEVGLKISFLVSTLLSLAYGAGVQQMDQTEYGRYLPHTVDERQSCEPNSFEQNRRVAAVTCDPEYLLTLDCWTVSLRSLV